jgi:hypothetical protein
VLQRRLSTLTVPAASKSTLEYFAPSVLATHGLSFASDLLAPPRGISSAECAPARTACMLVLHCHIRSIFEYWQWDDIMTINVRLLTATQVYPISYATLIFTVRSGLDVL